MNKNKSKIVRLTNIKAKYRPTKSFNFVAPPICEEKISSNGECEHVFTDEIEQIITLIQDIIKVNLCNIIKENGYYYLEYTDSKKSVSYRFNIYSYSINLEFYDNNTNVYTNVKIEEEHFNKIKNELEELYLIRQKDKIKDLINNIGNIHNLNRKNKIKNLLQ